MTVNPKLRSQIELTLHQHQVEPSLVIICHEGISPRALGFKPFIIPLLKLFDGNHTFSNIKIESQKLFGTTDVATDLLKALDEGIFLENENAELARSIIENDFKRSPYREAVFAGGIYPADPHERRDYVTKLIALSNAMRGEKSPSLIIAPHIDFRRGEITYGKTFASTGRLDWDITILIGTGHQAGEELFAVTKKPFRIPGHIFTTATEYIDVLEQVTGDWIYHDELRHRSEHSLELQLPFLAELAPSTTIMPILVGSFHNFLLTNTQPRTSAKYESFVKGLVESIRNAEAKGLRVGVLASVDMAHIGKDFGDTRPISSEWLDETEAADKEYITCVERLDAVGLLDHEMKDLDARRMCGFPTLFTVLDVVQRLQKPMAMRTIEYRQAVDYERQICVSFAGMIGE